MFVGVYEDVDNIFELTKALLQNNSRSHHLQRRVIPGQNKAAAIIIEELNRFQDVDSQYGGSITGTPIFLLVGHI